MTGPPPGAWDVLSLLPDLPGEALHARVARSLRSTVLRGVLAEGSRLPGHRRLAGQLGVSRNTLVDALAQLEAEGYVQVRGRSGTVVSVPGAPAPAGTATGPLPLSAWAERALDGRVADAAGEFRVDFRVGQPVAELYPEAAWTQALARRAGQIGQQPTALLDPLGPLETRRALAAYLNAERSARVTPEMVMLTAGTQSALDALARVFLEAGRVAAVEDPTYAGARAALAATGAALSPVRVDDQGLQPGDLPDSATLVYTTPGCQYPTTVALPAARRQALVAWAQQVNALILEDDYAADLHHSARPPAVLQGLAPERVILLGTFSKVLAPVTRSGFLVAPPEVIRVLAGTRPLTDRGPGTLDALALADVLSSGAYARHLRRVRPLIRHRQEVLIAALAGQSLGEQWPSWPARVAASGLHVYLPLPQGLSEADLEHRAARQGVALTLLGPFTGGDHPPAALLGFAHLPPEDLREGVRRLGRALRN
ncbi:PLP-dependent aminotransferase family protein [Deinococcus koreensis]|uniref:PLP-dependent aminotransferase family protein n=1 Tax=Deinococcus koreensis TaxID=2054903 RepID=A0A2K3V1N7_9DEIO|nr:PLP-dependent aminotransferase family protein [Deinococcus koreensis]PNY82695.1 PLP-dependent aminotransferase family protein [Deinococcus koreensis]